MSMNSRERFLAACACKDVDRFPVWLMRQAGRYLPEYREIREKYSFLEMCKRPDLAVEVSLQPLRRFGMDAVIFFSDILTIAQVYGFGLRFEEGKGPILDKRISSGKDVDALIAPHVRRSLSFALEALETLRHELKGETALLGFVGAPWTLACYMIEGGSGDFARALDLMKSDRLAVERLFDILTTTISDYAVEQIRAGADAVQIFDTWGGLLDASLYRECVLPRIRRISDAIRGVGGVPIFFVRDSEKLLSVMNESGAQVVGLGTNTDLPTAWECLGNKIATQGNLNPEVLLGSAASVVSETEKLIQKLKGRRGHIVNLGHGVLPAAKPDCVKAMVDTVKRSSNN